MNEMDLLLHTDQSFRNALRDLVAISSLPELWIHRTSEEIATGLAGVLSETLHLDLVYVSLNLKFPDREVNVAHAKSGVLKGQQVQQVAKTFESMLLQPDEYPSPFPVPNPVGDGQLRAIVMPIGIPATHGYLVAGSRATDFPDEFDELLLRMAVHQASAMLTQKQVENELRGKQQELTDFFENASEGLHRVGPDGTILWANQAELDMLGYTHDEYIGHKLDEFHADAFVAEDILGRLVNDQPVHEYEARLRCKDGSIRDVLINSSVYRENGKFIHTHSFTRDITERKQMEETLRRAYDDTEMRVEFRTKELSAAIEALKEEIGVRKRAEAEVMELRGRLVESRESERLLLAQELHDGPIQDLFALSYSLDALPETKSIPQLRSVQNGIAQAVGNLRRLCEDLRPSTLISFGLEKAIQTHLEQFQQQHPAYHVQFEVQEDGRLPERINLALFRIYQQALANILRHAQADQIFIGFRIEDGNAILEIRDNGRGFSLPESWIDFARQGHLGLIGAFERAEAVGGQLTVESAPGSGTRIQVRMPLDRAS